MAMNYAYAYAEIQDSDGMCVGVMDTTDPNQEGPTAGGTTYIRIPVCDPEYMFKFYIDGNWYEDPAGTIPWQSSML